MGNPHQLILNEPSPFSLAELDIRWDGIFECKEEQIVETELDPFYG
jgi:hypothetical protein